MALAGSSRSVTSLAKPERKGVYGCGREAAALWWGLCSSAASALGASAEGEQLTGVFHSLTLPWLLQRLGSGTRLLRLFSRGDLPIGLMTKAAAVLKTGYFLFFLSFLLNTWLEQRSAAFSAAFLTWERVQLALSSLALSLSLCAGEAACRGPQGFCSLVQAV